MANRLEQKEESRARILAAAGRGFRRHGYGGLGIDGLAREAGVTSGAFYAHFKSKTCAFRDVVTTGVKDLRLAVERLQSSMGAGWRQHLIDFYMSDRRTCDLADSCALQSLTAEVARSDDDVREAFEVELRAVIDAAAAGLTANTIENRRAEAVALLALLTGGVSLARAVKDQALSAEIAEAVRQAAIRLGE